jgi:hypothetical protein
MGLHRLPERQTTTTTTRAKNKKKHFPENPIVMLVHGVDD